MPELPEVETVRLGLVPSLEGVVLDRVELRRPDLRFPFPPRFSQRLAGRRIEALGRRAKYLLASLDGGDTLLMHLGMTGSFRVVARESGGEPVAGDAFHHARSKDGAHDHVRFHLGHGGLVVYNDPRRFGFMALIAKGERATHPLLAGLGPEPLAGSLDAAQLALAFKGRAAPLKAVLLDQRVIAGLGNIYVAEALWRARLSPLRPAGSLVDRHGRPRRGLERLTSAVVEVIADAIRAGGSSLRDYVQADGAPGLFQHAFAVYGRAGEACLRPACKGTIRRIVQAGRSTFYCPVCQG